MDSLIRYLKKGGFGIGGQELGTLVFADSIVFFADSIEGVQAHEDQVSRYMNKLDMTFNPRKSSSFLITSRRNTWVVRDQGRLWNLAQDRPPYSNILA
jgi:hypothetical protein